MSLTRHLYIPGMPNARFEAQIQWHACSWHNRKKGSKKQLPLQATPELLFDQWRSDNHGHRDVIYRDEKKRKEYEKHLVLMLKYKKKEDKDKFVDEKINVEKKWKIANDAIAQKFKLDNYYKFWRILIKCAEGELQQLNREKDRRENKENTGML